MKTTKLRIGKYVIVNNCPVLFPVDIQHNQVTVTGQSAGFFLIKETFNSKEVFCWGESSTLNLPSDPAKDAQLLKEFLEAVSLTSKEIPTFAPLLAE